MKPSTTHCLGFAGLLPACCIAAIVLSGCAPGESDRSDLDDPASRDEGAAPKFPLRLGAHVNVPGTHVNFRVISRRATRIEVHLYADPMDAAPVAHYAMSEDPATHEWYAHVSLAELASQGLGEPIYYGYRAWGPNWSYDPAWKPGSLAGFVADVDEDGNRFNPNKLLLDPYALEVSHDPRTPEHSGGAVYGSGSSHRAKDSGPVAPKGIVIPSVTDGWGEKPPRPLKDDVIYEVHVRGFTMNDPEVAPELRGTYAGAAQKAAYLQSLGVTAVEFLPLHETQNDTNDMSASTSGQNYWGYATLSFFAPDRRYAADKSPGGPSRELREMVHAFHDAGIKVYVDVVYNHTGEGGLWGNNPDLANLVSWRGLDNAAYYERAANERYFYDNTGTGANFNTANDIARNLIVDSLQYWTHCLGVDGFRFDLAPVLGNTCDSGCFQYDKQTAQSALNRAVKELPVRSVEGGAGVDLIAEPWAASGGYQLGNFPAGWAEWNGKYRDAIRRAQNVPGATISPKELGRRLTGSRDLFGDDGRRPWHSINFVVAHDGFTLRDLYSYDEKQNDQAWPYGPSSGGTDDNLSSDQDGDPAKQRQAARTGLSLLMLSIGVPMITGGDEMYRTQFGNNNPYNLDSDKNWLDWSNASTHASFADFARRLIRFRGAHPVFRPTSYLDGKDHDGNGLRDITWYRETGAVADDAYLSSTGSRFIAFRLDGAERGDSVRSIYVAYNRSGGPVTLTLPAGNGWYRAGDTAATGEWYSNFALPGKEKRIDSTYILADSAVLVMIER